MAVGITWVVVDDGAVVVSGQSYSSFPFLQSALPSQAHRIGMHDVELHANSPGQLLSKAEKCSVTILSFSFLFSPITENKIMV